MAGAIAVFVGPTLGQDEARALCPQADIRPPARRGDLLAAVLHEGVEAIGLVDGEFDQALSVWHKEVLYALEAGVAVLGASSIGALRAAELDSFGMRGIGQVYEAYASGEVVDDDEVALTFAEDGGTYVNTSVPMVNVRATCRAAVEAGDVSEGLGGRAVAAVKALHYPERSYARMGRLLADAGEPAGDVAALAQYVAAHAVDVKADDCRLLLRELATTGASTPPPPGLYRSVAFDTLFRRERPLAAGRDLPAVPVDDVVGRFLAQSPDAAQVRDAALDRGFLLMTAEILGIVPGDAEVDAELARLRARAAAGGGADRWLARNALSERELHDLARDEAVCSILRRWTVGAMATVGDAPLVVDYLRTWDQLEPWLEPSPGG